MAQPYGPASSPPLVVDSGTISLSARLCRIGDWPWLKRVMPAVFPEIGPSHLSHLLRNLRHLIAVVVDDQGRRIGFCQLHHTEGAPVMWVNFIGVDPEARRGGAGKMLLDWTEDYAARLGCSRVELDVVASNQGAIAFYDRLSYHRSHALVDDMGREKLRYTKTLHPHTPPVASLACVPCWPLRVFQKVLYGLCTVHGR